MSIADEITRIKNAKTAIATSISNKGVTVPEETKIDGYSQLIDNIKTIPEGYVDVSDIYIDPACVLSGIKYVDRTGAKVGTMPDIGELNIDIDGTVEYTSVPAGYTGGGRIAFRAPFEGAVYPWLTINSTEIALRQYQNGVGLEGARTIILPDIETINGGAFMSCTEVECFDIGANVQTVNSAAFNGCSKLTKLIIRGLLTTKLSLISTPINAGTYGYIYVPDEYLEQYTTNENWSIFASRIKPISEL